MREKYNTKKKIKKVSKQNEVGTLTHTNTEQNNKTDSMKWQSFHLLHQIED